jgi:hypothetical protein
MTMTATYSPEDNKLRLYSVARLPEDVYKRVRAAGFIWAPKQDLFVAPKWNPQREDLLIELCDDIGDEDYSAVERSADRAERFSDYRDKRETEADTGADTFEAGPAAFGHQNRARAERQAARHDRNRTLAVNQWGKAEYWQARTAAVIAHALFKSAASVRRGRILVLEAEQRKHNKSRAEYETRYRAWQKVPTLEGADIARPPSAEGSPVLPSYRLAYALANYHDGLTEYAHPRAGHKASLYSLLTAAVDPITPAEAAALWLDGRTDPALCVDRWGEHYNNRLAYERAMLAQEGGTVAAVDMEPGGWINTGNRTRSVFTNTKDGWKQIQGVNKSSATGRVTSVKVWGTTTGYSRESNYTERSTKPCLVNINVERLPEDAYMPPTDTERETFAAEKSQRKAEEKASKPKAPALINPTDADAERLQKLWNDRAQANHRDKYSTFKPAEVLRITQAVYSRNSTGSYAKVEARTLHACGRPARRSTNMWSSEGQKYDASLGAAVCKIRVHGYPLKSVIVITDKPQKPIPLDWAAVESSPVAEVSQC